MEPFGPLVREIRKNRNQSQNALAALVHIDPSYLQRIEHLQRPAPSEKIVELLADALHVSAAERDRLYAAAGLLPPSARRLERWDGAITLVAGVMADPEINDLEQTTFAMVVTEVALHWRAAGLYLAEAVEREVSA